MSPSWKNISQEKQKAREDEIAKVLKELEVDGSNDEQYLNATGAQNSQLTSRDHITDVAYHISLRDREAY